MATTDSSSGAASSHTPSQDSIPASSQCPRASAEPINLRSTMGKDPATRWRYESYQPPETDPELKGKRPDKAREGYRSRKTRGPKSGRNTADLAKAAALAHQVRDEEEKAQAIIDNRKIADKEAKENEARENEERKAAARAEKMASNQREAQMLGSELVARMVWPNQKWQTFVHEFGKYRLLAYVGYVCLFCSIVLVQAIESVLSLIPCVPVLIPGTPWTPELEGWGYVPNRTVCIARTLPVIPLVAVTTIFMFFLCAAWLAKNYRYRKFHWRSAPVHIPQYTSVAREVDEKKCRPQVWGDLSTDSYLYYRTAVFNVGLFQECCSIAGLGRSLEVLRSAFCRRINQLPEWREELHTAYRNTLSVTAMLAADYVYESEQSVDISGSGEVLSLQRMLNTTSSATASQIACFLLAIFAILNFQPMLWAIFLKLALGRLRRELFLCLLMAWRLASQRGIPSVLLRAASTAMVAACRLLTDAFVGLWQSMFVPGSARTYDPPMTSMSH